MLRAKASIAVLVTPTVRIVSRHLPFTRRWLWNRVIGPYLSWRDYQFVVKTEFGALMEGTTSDVIQRYIYYFGMWEPNVEVFLRARLRPGDIFIDVGANIGYLTLLGAKLVGRQGRVVAIEASNSALEHLKANVARNRFEGLVRCVHAAASDCEGMTTLYEGQRGNMGSASIGLPPWASRRCFLPAEDHVAWLAAPAHRTRLGTRPTRRGSPMRRITSSSRIARRICNVVFPVGCSIRGRNSSPHFHHRHRYMHRHFFPVQHFELRLVLALRTLIGFP